MDKRCFYRSLKIESLETFILQAGHSRWRPEKDAHFFNEDLKEKYKSLWFIYIVYCRLGISAVLKIDPMSWKRIYSQIKICVHWIRTKFPLCRCFFPFSNNTHQTNKHFFFFFFFFYNRSWNGFCTFSLIAPNRSRNVCRWTERPVLNMDPACKNINGLQDEHSNHNSTF